MGILRFGLRGARWGALVGLACGVLYSIGGLIVDLATIGLNWGTLLAFLSLLGMPLLFAAPGFVVGLVVGVARKVVQAG